MEFWKIKRKYKRKPEANAPGDAIFYTSQLKARRGMLSPIRRTGKPGGKPSAMLSGICQRYPHFLAWLNFRSEVSGSGSLVSLNNTQR